MNSLLNAAIKYADAGWHIFPVHCMKDGLCSCGDKECTNPGKHPRIKNGSIGASNDKATIEQWWSKWPDANIAVRCGPESGIWVIDADLPDGPQSVKGWDIPLTLTQKTGGGGLHYFYSWNGREIRNSTKKVAPGVDIRGINGYVLLPPSNHESGHQYKWLTAHKDLIVAPDWLAEKVCKHLEPEPPRSTHTDRTRYGQAALADEMTKLAMASKGARNATLNECAFNLSQLVAGGELDESSVRAALCAGAAGIGLTSAESVRTIDSGFRAGLGKPRKVTEVTEVTHITKSNEKSRKVTESNADPRRFQGNLTGHIREYVQEIQGVFTAADIDREFGLTHPADKSLRRKIILVLEKEKYIKKDLRIVGKYHVLKTQVDFIDFTAIDPSPFKISLPLDLSDMVRIPKKSLIVVAGTTNAGKTALAIDILRRNLDRPYQLMYLMSEMGPSEYKQRITTSVADLAGWQAKVKAADCPGGFDTVIAKYNPRGLTVIDFLEEIQGEYFRIASDLRAIYDSLDDGVAVVCLQKHTKSDTGRGGEATAEKPRLYMALDKLAYAKDSTISALKIYKAKDYIGNNPNGRERHIAFERYGADIRPLTPWMYCNAIQRASYVLQYENKIMANEQIGGQKEGICLEFLCTCGTRARLVQRDIDRWRKSFDRINVDSELLKIMKDSEAAPWLDKKKYFFQIAGILTKKNEKEANQCQ